MIFVLLPCFSSLSRGFGFKDEDRISLPLGLSEAELQQRFIHESRWIPKIAMREIVYPAYPGFFQRREMLPHRMMSAMACPIYQCGVDWNMEKQQQARRAVETVLIQEGVGMDREITSFGYNWQGWRLPQ
ncbi:MAG: hypothetical protein LBP90_06530 [Burkholderiales bacterium]|nr:hypothetical protein [Burkholderiales bacterium]